MSDKALKRASLDYGIVAELTRHASWSNFLAAPERADGRLILFTTRAATPHLAFQFQPGDTLLMGRESAGVPDEVHAAADARVFIPISPKTRSLNVVVAAAMALGEGLRQINGFPAVPAKVAP